ncbi:MAG: SWIM zinc finger family protein [Bacillota bacterium]
MAWEQFSEVHLEAAVSPEIYQRGVNYFQEGQLSKTCRFDNVIAGIVIGTGGNYRVNLSFNGAKLQGDCSCPYQGFCKHMAALALGWLEKKDEFIDLRPEFDRIINHQSKLPETLERLIAKDPVNFLELRPNHPGREFITARGIFNLIRNTFGFTQINPTRVEQLWDQVQRLVLLISDRLTAGDPEAPAMFTELISAFAASIESYQDECLIRLFEDLLQRLSNLSNKPPNYLRTVTEKLVNLYFNPVLYGAAVPIREALIKLGAADPVLFFREFEAKLAIETPLLDLILLYELASRLAEENSQFATWVEKAARCLESSPAGWLWLTDRLLETDLQEAYRKAREGLRSFPGEKKAFQERLIKVHQLKGELKQAASLSFILFKAEPNFEEYQRLKTLLAGHPSELKGYLPGIKECLSDGNREILALQIAVDLQDYQFIEEQLKGIIEDDDLLQLAVRLFTDYVPPSPEQIYPILIKALVSRETAVYWKLALELMVIYKQICHHQELRDNWEALRNELNRLYQEHPGFRKKFAQILAG